MIKLLLVHVLALEQRRIARVLDLPFLQHLAHNHLDVLVIDLDALQAIDLLHFVDHIVCQRLNTQNC